MPHLILEHSSNIKYIDCNSLFEEFHNILSDYADINTCKSRRMVSDSFLVGSDSRKQAFVHIRLYLMPGRNTTLKDEISGKLLAHSELVFAKLLKGQNLVTSLSVSVEDLQSYHKVILSF